MLSKISFLVAVLCIGNAFAQCGPGEGKLSVSIQYDSTPTQTTVELTNIPLGDVMVLPINQPANALVSYTKCVATKTLFKVALKDSAGDGFSGSAYASITINDRLIATISDYTSEVAYYFSIDASSCGLSTRWVLNLKYDSNPATTSATLVNNANNAAVFILSGLNGSNMASQFLYVDLCITTGLYTFSITDTDGLAAPGFYRVFSEDTLLAVGSGSSVTSSTTFSVIDSTLAPTFAPTFPPTLATDPCDDRIDVRLKLNATFPSVTCRWLFTRPREARVYCVQGNPSKAYDICAETCGKCTDTCEDSTAGAVFEDNDGVPRGCYWLANDPFNRVPKYCAPGTTAWKECKEACGNCL